jgi:hypothetical protein
MLKPSHKYRIIWQTNWLISNEMIFNHEINASEIILDLKYPTVNPAIQTAATLNVQLHSS